MANETVTAGIDANLMRYLLNSLDTVSNELEKVFAIATAGEALCEKSESFTERQIFATITDLVTEGLINEKLDALRRSIKDCAIRI